MLIADDVEVNRASLGAIFEDEYEIVEAQDGNDAIRQLQNKKIDIVILDLFMPGLDGAEVLKWMKSEADYSHIPVVVKTAIDENTESEILEAGADDFIFSPCNPAIIKNRVKNIAQKYIYEHELLHRQVEKERHLRCIRDEFTMEMFWIVCEGLEKMISLSKSALEERDLERMQESLQTFCRSGEQMKTLLSDVSEIYKIGQKGEECNEKVFSVRKLAERLSNQTFTNEEGKPVKILFQEVEQKCEYLLGDMEHIEQIWKKLLTTVCAKADEERVVKTMFSVRQLEEKRAVLEISVEAAGRIEMEEAQYLITKSMIKILQGISRKEEKENTAFFVKFPLRTAKIPVRECVDFRTMRVLSVGEEEIYRDYYAAIFNRLGLKFDVVKKEEEALRLLKLAYEEGESYDVCFVNWQMQETEASGFVEKVRKQYDQDTVLLVCLSNNKEILETEITKAGADYVLAKPVFQSTVYQLLTDICQGKTEK